ncbi:hypothetical protein EF902_02725 [Streptomyces sp. WAC05858]|nr:hypothetical protein EF902_02725 [Streptomyces sp. WAC05858]
MGPGIGCADESGLRDLCREVTEFGTVELARLIDDMFATNQMAEGAGLAANRVDVDLQLSVWDITHEWGMRHVGHTANPVPEEVSADGRRLVEELEGCLSVPGPDRVRHSVRREQLLSALEAGHGRSV